MVQRFAAPRAFPAATRVGLILKGLSLIHSETVTAGTNWALGSMVEEPLHEVVCRDLGHQDMAAVVRLAEAAASVELSAAAKPSV